MSTKPIKAFKITNEAGSSGAYWRGNEKNKMLARIYATAFTKAADLDEFIKAREEAKLRDHNKLGREMHLLLMLLVRVFHFLCQRVQELFRLYRDLLKTKNKREVIY